MNRILWNFVGERSKDVKKKVLSAILAILMVTTLFSLNEADASKHADIVTHAKEQLGVPYRFGGTTPSGFDCSGFIGYVYKKVGIELPRTASGQFGAGKSVSKSDLQVGDLVFFETYKPGPSHSGIYIGDDQFIHVSSTRGVSISSVNDPYYWAERYLGARRILEDDKIVKQLAIEYETLPAGQYHDIPTNFWAKQEIETLGINGLITGYDQSFFRPNNDVTRAQVAIILARAFDLVPTTYSGDFDDVNENFYAYEAIQAVVDAGLFNGDTNGNFRPNAPFTREHIAIVFSKAFNLPKASEVTDFTDVVSSQPSFEPIQQLAASGITTGFNDNTFRPEASTTRAQFAVFLHRALYE